MSEQPSRARQWAKAIGLAFAAFVVAAIFAAALRGGAWIVAALAVVGFLWLMVNPIRAFAGFSPGGSRKVAGSIAALTVLLAIAPPSPHPASTRVAAVPVVSTSRAAMPASVRVAEPAAASATDATSTPDNKLELVKFDWQKDGFGTVMMLDATIRNAGAVAMKDMVLRCTTFGASGTELGHHAQTIYDIVQAGQTRRFRKLSLGFLNPQADRAECAIVKSSLSS